MCCIPGLPGRNLRLEGREAVAHSVPVDLRNSQPVVRLEVPELDGRRIGKRVVWPYAELQHVRLLSAVVVEGELRGMWPQTYNVGLVLALVIDPGADQLLAEHARRGEELVIPLERVERLAERSRNLGDAAVLFEEIPIGRLACVEPLLDPVEAGHQHRGEREVRVGSG